MEFWAAEAPSGKPLTCDPGKQNYIHISQAAIGDKIGKGNERVVLKVKANNQEVVVGTLSQGKCDQIPLDLIFDKPFVLSHNSPSTSVYFCGYKSEASDGFDSGKLDEDLSSEEDFSSEENLSSDEGQPVQPPVKESGKPKSVKVEMADAKPSKPTPKENAEALEKQQSLKLKPKKDDDEDGEDDEDEDESDEDLLDASDDDLGSDEDESDQEESDEDEQPKIMPAGQKRSILNDAQAAGVGKKAKLATPVEAKKQGKPALIPTPSPKQQSSKKDVSAKKAKKENGLKSETPSSGKKGQFNCQPCNKSFQSEAALAMHNSAKHKS